MSQSTPYLSSFRAKLIFIFISVAGAFSIFFLPISYLPSDHNSTISIRFSWSKNNAIELEREITSRIEARLSSVRDINKIRSYSLPNFGLINVTINNHIDINHKHHEIIKLLRSFHSELPDDTKIETPVIVKSDQNNFILAISSSLSSEQYWEVLDSLLYDFKTINARLIHPIVQHTPHLRLTPNTPIFNLSLGPEQVQNAFSFRKGETLLGHLADSKPVVLKSQREYSSLDEIQVHNDLGKEFPLWRLFSWSQVRPKARTIHKIDGLPTRYLQFTYPKTENPIVFNNILKRILKKYQHDRKRAGVHLDLVNNPVQNFEDELKSIAIRVIISLFMLVLATYFFYKNLTYGLIVLTSLLITVLSSTGIIYLLGIEINLYTLAGIALSFGLIVDNMLVTLHHIVSGQAINYRFAITAATISSIGTAFTIFLLPDEQALLMEGFVYIVTISLSFSLLVSILLIPHLVQPPSTVQKKPESARKIGSMIEKPYLWVSTKVLTGRRLIFPVLVLVFGLPVYLIPSEINTGTALDQPYNELASSDYFNTQLRPFLSNYLGGFSTRFKQHIEKTEGISFTPEPPQTLRMSYQSPDRIETDHVIQIHNEFETYLKSFEQVKSFVSTIEEQSFNIEVFFSEKNADTFPRVLAGLLQQKASQHSGALFKIAIKDLYLNSGWFEVNSSGLRIKGYNYDQILELCADIERQLSNNARIENISLTSDGKSDLTYILQLASDDLLSFDQHFSQHALSNVLSVHSTGETNVFSGKLGENQVTINMEHGSRDFWSLQRYPIAVNSTNIRLERNIDMVPNKREPYIERLNQQYIVDLTFDYLGPNIQASRFLDGLLLDINATFPVGFKAEKIPYGSGKFSIANQRLTIIFAILIVFVISAILLESIRTALNLVFYLLLSLVGVFIGFLITGSTFDLGAVTAVIFLCGLIVNNAFYVLTEIQVRVKWKRVSNSKEKAAIWVEVLKLKSPSILMTSVTSIIGLLPFLFHNSINLFWYQFSLCTVSGLSFSLLILYLLLPCIFGSSIFTQNN
ncbi:MAG: efflux RND transporter permease subunit [Cytophagales bacterium]|nr:efflux RND transporter permease subunit [Cytophagales bacterium]